MQRSEGFTNSRTITVTKNNVKCKEVQFAYNFTASAQLYRLCIGLFITFGLVRVCLCACALLSFCIGSFVVCISEYGLSVKWINVLAVGIQLHYSACHVIRHYF